MLNGVKTGWAGEPSQSWRKQRPARSPTADVRRCELDSLAGALGTLRCHVARSNPVWQVSSGDEMLVVFRAADAYISPQWYPSKHEFHKQVPTWNYLVAHAHGRLTVHDDERFVRRNVAKLTHRHESSQPVPWKMGDAPREFIDTLVKDIVGLEIEITRLIGKAKLSQTKEPRDIRKVGEVLVAHGNLGVGQAMLAAAARKVEQG
ncbi:FMN-binding negative transcriptional regulator [Mesorhizobium opportunistum]|uniref:FMN-binding negative transcriptional regulator n=1 Tax=Mesorhizobium opportunistum (strain LMG 24607 / HAMBI 3007 / WSM2075) TaxID=536019 RepID=F7YAU9_MESOW|nr:FMN-binding negative transcriptional regulator [Mesorhizobium opportunistum]AEH89925.1 FMN-binding negative transcriptional regulator [Mesorhizobium opportunistum WSM2075]